MESGKRKREEGTRSVVNVPIPTTDEEEVEEFFAILRRMRAAARCLKRSDGDLAAAERWRPEDFGNFKEDKDARVGIEVATSENSSSKSKSKSSKLGLDLNCAPPPNDDVL